MFPLTFRWEDGEVEACPDMDYLCCNIEWFDSEDGDAVVTDALGRPVRLKLEATEVRLLQLAPPKR